MRITWEGESPEVVDNRRNECHQIQNVVHARQVVEEPQTQDLHAKVPREKRGGDSVDDLQTR